MSQIKAYNPEIAIIVGINASLLLQHIKYWVEKYSVEKVYRTNQQVSEDFKGTLSESQVQRAKKKLVDAGLIVVTHDQCYTRTTHYTLTEKAKGLLGMVVAVVEKVKKAVKKVKSSITGKPKTMKDSFKEQGDTSHAIPMPKDILDKLRGCKSSSDTSYWVNTEDDTEDDQINDDEYFKALDESMAMCQQKEFEPELSFSEVMSKAFNQVPNIEQFEKNRMTLEHARNFKEDY